MKCSLILLLCIIATAVVGNEARWAVRRTNATTTAKTMEKEVSTVDQNVGTGTGLRQRFGLRYDLDVDRAEDYVEDMYSAREYGGLEAEEFDENFLQNGYSVEYGGEDPTSSNLIEIGHEAVSGMENWREHMGDDKVFDV
eukprot:jgi/Bigna1/85788/estExt_fgenesh1_pg.C_60119